MTKVRYRIWRDPLKRPPWRVARTGSRFEHGFWSWDGAMTHVDIVSRHAHKPELRGNTWTRNTT